MSVTVDTWVGLGASGRPQKPRDTQELLNPAQGCSGTQHLWGGVLRLPHGLSGIQTPQEAKKTIPQPASRSFQGPPMTLTLGGGGSPGPDGQAKLPLHTPQGG